MTRDVKPLLVNWWAAKNESVARLAAAGKSETGAQARNTLHMQSIALFVRQMFVDAGLAETDVTVDSVVPGYFRRSKNWDVVAMHKGHLVGVVELKSQASSPGNNANNRIEEAIGSSVDAKAVQDLTGAFGNLGVWAAWCNHPGKQRIRWQSQVQQDPPGNPYLQGALGAAAMACAQNPRTYLAARYRRIAARRGPQKANVAVQHSMLVASWHMATNGCLHDEPGADYFNRINPDRTRKRAIHQLEAMGYEAHLSNAS